MAAFAFDNFTGGTASDKYVGQEGTFYDSSNVNIHSSPEEVSLSKISTQFGANDGGGGTGAGRDVIAMLQIWSDIFQICSDGALFKNFTGWPFLTNTYGGNTYVFEDAIVFGSYVYIAARRSSSDRFAIFRDTVANWTAGTYSLTVDWAYLDYGSTALCNADYGTRFIAYKGTQLIFARRNRIWSLSSSQTSGAGGNLATIATIYLVLPSESEITCLTQNSEFIRAYTFDGWLYYWAGANLQPDYAQKLGLPVVRGVSDFKTDYVMTIDRSVFEVVGFDYKRLIKGQNTLVNWPMALYVSDGRFGNSMAMTNEFVFIPELNGVVAYGRLQDFLPKSANRKWTISGNENTLISCMFVSKTYQQTPNLYVAWENSSTAVHRIEQFVSGWRDELSSNDYGSTGFIETLSYFGKSFYKRKTLKRILVAYDITASDSGTIDIQVAMDWGSYWTAVTISDHTKRYAEILPSQISGSLEFHEIKAKITLTRETATKTPIFKEIIFEYDDIQRS